MKMISYYMFLLCIPLFHQTFSAERQGVVAGEHAERTVIVRPDPVRALPVSFVVSDRYRRVIAELAMIEDPLKIVRIEKETLHPHAVFVTRCAITEGFDIRSSEAMCGFYKSLEDGEARAAEFKHFCTEADRLGYYEFSLPQSKVPDLVERAAVARIRWYIQHVKVARYPLESISDEEVLENEYAKNAGFLPLSRKTCVGIVDILNNHPAPVTAAYDFFRVSNIHPGSAMRILDILAETAAAKGGGASKVKLS